MRKLINKKEQKNFRQYLRNGMNKGERILWQRLKNSQLGFKFRRQSGFGKYIVDFYCPEVNLVIEIDGLTHYEEHIYDKDVVREKFLVNLGLVVRRYNSGLIFENIDEVVEDIYQVCLKLKQ